MGEVVGLSTGGAFTMVSLGGAGSLGAVVWVPAELLARNSSFILPLRLVGGMCRCRLQRATARGAIRLQRGLIRIPLVSSGGATIQRWRGCSRPARPKGMTEETEGASNKSNLAMRPTVDQVRGE